MTAVWGNFVPVRPDLWSQLERQFPTLFRTSAVFVCVCVAQPVCVAQGVLHLIVLIAGKSRVPFGTHSLLRRLLGRKLRRSSLSQRAAQRAEKEAVQHGVGVEAKWD